MNLFLRGRMPYNLLHGKLSSQITLITEISELLPDNKVIKVLSGIFP